MVLPTIGGRLFPAVLQGIEQAASQAGFNIIVCQSYDDVLLERRHIDTLLNAQVAGILVSLAGSTEDFQHFDKVNSRGVPLLFFDNAPAATAVNSVVIDDHSGGFQATRHLLDQGCLRIAHLAGPQHAARYRQRRQGYLDALASAGVPLDERLIIYSDLQQQDGADAMRQLLTLSLPPDGVVGANYPVLAGALQMLKNRRIAVPQQVTLAGCSNEGFPLLTEPALTSVDQPSEEMGRAAVGLFLELAAATTSFPRQVLLQPELVMRASSMRQHTHA